MAAIKQLQLQIDSFLANQMQQNSKTATEIQALRITECVEVTIQGANQELLSIEGLESRFQQQQQASARVTIPSTDILQWKASFPLYETTEHVLDDLRRQYKDKYKQGDDMITQAEGLIDEELNSLTNGQDIRVTANKIADNVENAVIVDPNVPPNSPVRKKLRREIENVLTNGGAMDHKAGIIVVLRNILHEGIDILLRNQNKTKWGMIVNRRGQVGENKRVPAIMVMSLNRMKTHS